MKQMNIYPVIHDKNGVSEYSKDTNGSWSYTNHDTTDSVSTVKILMGLRSLKDHDKTESLSTVRMQMGTELDDS